MATAPGGSTWTATIGSKQDIRYRVEGRGQVAGREATCLKAADGALIRCAHAAPGSTEEKELERREQQKQKDENPKPPQNSGDLPHYSAEELAELRNASLDGFLHSYGSHRRRAELGGRPRAAKSVVRAVRLGRTVVLRRVCVMTNAKRGMA